MRFLEWLKSWRDNESRDERGTGQEDVGETEDEGEIDPFNPFPEPIRLEILDVFDLHTIAPRDVKRTVVEISNGSSRGGLQKRADYSRQRYRRAARDSSQCAGADIFR